MAKCFASDMAMKGTGRALQSSREGLHARQHVERGARAKIFKIL